MILLNIKTYFISRKKLAIFLSSLLIFFISFSIFYFIYSSRGFLITRYDELLIARNWAKTGIAAYESKDNVILASDLIIQEGVPTTLGNRLTFYIYGIIFRSFGFFQTLPVFISFALYSLAAVLLFILFLKIFDFKIALIAASLNLVSPFFLPYTISLGKSEWAYLFMVLATIIYFWPVKQKGAGRLVLTGLFLGLSVASRNSFFIVFLPFLFLETYPFIRKFFLFRIFTSEKNIFKKNILRPIILSLVFLAVAAPFSLLGNNSYFGLAFGGQKFESFHILGHLFPDPYTYRTQGDEFIKDFLKEQDNGSLMERFRLWGDSGMFLEDFSATGSFGIFRTRIIPIFYSIYVYLKAFLSLIVFGGLLLWLLIFIGFSKLTKIKDKENEELLVFFAAFFILWFLGLIIPKTSNYPHLIMLSFPILAMSSLGLEELAGAIAKINYLDKLSKGVAMAAVIIVFLFSFWQLSWWHLREYYNNSFAEAAGERFIKNYRGANPFNSAGLENVIAVGYFQKAPVLFNYHFDRNFIYFAPKTLQKLAAQKKLDDVFKDYQISGFVGYEKNISDLINKETNNRLKNYDEK